jgi:hypothetical protein
MASRARADDVGSEVKALNVRNMPIETIHRMKAGAARQGVPLAQYLVRLARLESVLRREARKSGNRATDARHHLREAELPMDPAED